MTTVTAVEIHNLVKRYGSRTAVDGLNLRINAGEIFGLLGPNGAGKTTTIETLAGLRTPTDGWIRVLGVDPIVDHDELRRVLTLQPQHAALFGHLSVEETLQLWASFHERPDDPETVLNAFGLTDSRNIRISRLSGGQRQRVLVATAVIGNPRLLVLDEPSTGLDPNARASLWEVIRGFRDRGGTVLLSTHAMAEAEALCDRVAIVHRGRVAAYGPPEELVRVHTAGQQVTLTTQDPAVIDVLRHLPTVEVVEAIPQETGIRIKAHTTDADELLRAAFATGASIHGVHTDNGGLDAVFQALTGEAFEQDASS